MSKLTYLLSMLALLPFTATAEQLNVQGKIISTQGHYVPACRIIKVKENGTGAIKWFRIVDVATHDDVNSVALTALVANRDIVIYYDPAVTTGCGTEPRIQYIEIM